MCINFHYSGKIALYKIARGNFIWLDKNRFINIISASFPNGSAQLTGEAPGLQIRCGALKPSRVGSIPMHFRHFFSIDPINY